MVAVYAGINMLDTYLIQPVIYSSSIKAHPGDLPGNPHFRIHGRRCGNAGGHSAYTVIRVFASEFLSRFKVVQKLTAKLPDHGD